MSNDPSARYFDYLARAFPVMCASDEFHFLPRVQAAAEHYDQLEDMDAERMAGHIHCMAGFQKEFLALAGQSEDATTRIDLQALALSAGAALAELERARSWQLNPLLYLKVACIGLDHALNKPAPALPGERGERISRAEARLAAWPRLLAQAEANLTGISASHKIAGPAMAADGCRYLREIKAQWLDKAACVSPRFSPLLEQAHSALERFGKFLATCPVAPPLPEDAPQGPNLETTLAQVFGTSRTPEEIFHIASQDREASLAKLKRLGRSLARPPAPDRSWLELHLAHDPPEAHGLSTEELYQREIARLRHFFLEQLFPDQHPDTPLELAHTPTYLLSVRSAASFGAAFSRDPREVSYFYVTPGSLSGRSPEASARLDRRFRGEVKFLTAHESYPGHHLLDGVRRFLPAPVASQMENAVFYEGWAYFGEGLLEEYGYVEDPNDLLTHHKRCLWRAVRCMADVGRAAGLLGQEEAVTLLGEVGFSREEALGQIHRFRLNPGYQVCYTLGRYEITRLYKKFGGKGLDGFCRALLSCGQLPFHLVEQRLEGVQRRVAPAGK